MKILVVDDETDVTPLFLQRFRREIKSGEMEFVFAHSGEDALTILRDHQQRAVLILSDINMPGMSGLDLLKRIKTDFNEPPSVVMMISAYGDSDNYNAAMQMGADEFITKPVDFEVLKTKIRELGN
jgi:two-component system chemotaxis response regulator CheY